MTVRRFTKGKIHELDGGPYDDDNPSYDCVKPNVSDNGTYYIVDCWITNSNGEKHPGYNISPVPIHTDNIGIEV